MRILNLLCTLGVAGLLGGCGEKSATFESKPPAKHGHKPLHGGTPVVLGNEEYHIELVRDAAAGKLQAYVMDGELENFVRIPAESFEVVAQLSGRPEILVFSAVASNATGEKIGDTSWFEAEAGWLKTTETFDAVLKELIVRGKKFEHVAFSFPKGNDSDEMGKRQ